MLTTRWCSSTTIATTCAALLVAGCSHAISTPPPAVSAVAPDLVCNGASVTGIGADGSSRVTITGQDFTPMPSRTLDEPRRLLLPRITLTPAATLPGLVLPGPIQVADDPAAPADSRVQWASETSMSFDVRPVDALAPGVFDLAVTNPDGSVAVALAQALAIVPPPTVTTVAPAAICQDQADQTIAVAGAGFLVFDGATPTITLGTAPDIHTYAATFQPADCAPIPGTFVETNVALCSVISFTLPQHDLDVATTTAFELVVTNPPPADCASSAAIQVTIEPPPRVDSVAPSTVCEGGSQVTVTGANFQPGATVTLDCAGSISTTDDVTVTPDGSQLAATFTSGGTPGTACDVIVHNPDGCEDRPLPHHQVTVTAGPVVFFVDPPVAYNGINTRINVFATTIAGPLVEGAVTIRLTGTTATPIALAFNTVPAHPNRVQAIVPLGLQVGIYDLTLHDATRCGGTLRMALTVTDTLTVTMAQVTPSFGATAEDTDVTILRDVNAAPPAEHPFQVTPRVFLNPTNPGASDVAVEVVSVAFLDGDRVTGNVPAGTPPHVYDVVLVNPDGSVGLLVAGYTETAAPPPTLDTATPASIVGASGQGVVLAGSNFTGGDVISLACVDAAGVNLPAPGVVAAGPICTGSACSQSITIDGSTVPTGSVCVVRVTNPDTAFGEFSAIGVTTASLNLNDPEVGPDMIVGRRALSSVAGSASTANRFVYAIGGDSGTAAGALDSVEFSPIDVFGNNGPFVLSPPALRAPTTLAGAVTVGRYIYLAGGNDGTGPTARSARAIILSPRETPVIDDIDVTLAAQGLDGGEYHYRVSAVFSAADPDNPGGESLASDPLTLRLPTSSEGGKFDVTLIWRAPRDILGVDLPNVASYRIYRNPAANDPPGSEVLIATVAATATQFVDDGSLVPGVEVPRPLGSTGSWAAMPDLGIAREALAVTASFDAFQTQPATSFYVYALLGRTGAATATASYEFLTGTVAPNGHQTIVGTAWTPGTTASAVPRSQLGVWYVDQAIAAFYGATQREIFIGGGLLGDGSLTGKVEAALVKSGGQLGAFSDTPKDFSSTAAGYGVTAANGQLFVFGGAGAAPSGAAKSATLISPAQTLANNSWNNEGLSMTHGRYLMGSAVQSSFIFLLGGQTDEPSAASTTTERVIW